MTNSKMGHISNSMVPNPILISWGTEIKSTAKAYKNERNPTEKECSIVDYTGSRVTR